MKDTVLQNRIYIDINKQPAIYWATQKRYWRPLQLWRAAGAVGGSQTRVRGKQDPHTIHQAVSPHDLHEAVRM